VDSLSRQDVHSLSRQDVHCAAGQDPYCTVGACGLRWRSYQPRMRLW
jgi:hypothetical protein